jgi:hypothetical protein
MKKTQNHVLTFLCGDDETSLCVKLEFDTQSKNYILKISVPNEQNILVKKSGSLLDSFKNFEELCIHHFAPQYNSINFKAVSECFVEFHKSCHKSCLSKLENELKQFRDYVAM